MDTLKDKHSLETLHETGTRPWAGLDAENDARLAPEPA